MTPISASPIVPRTRSKTDILFMDLRAPTEYRRRGRVFVSRCVLPLLLLVLLHVETSHAQTSAQPLAAPAQDPQQPPPPAPPTLDVTVTVVGTTPLPGVELPREEVPAPVQTATGKDIDNSGALNLADFLNRRVNGVIVNEMQGNPYQPDINYRGYTASPLLGT